MSNKPWSQANNPLAPTLPLQEEVVADKLQEQCDQLEAQLHLKERRKDAKRRQDRLRGRIRHLGGEPVA